ncbi:diguanylate cyclase [Salmonella enterica subsp. enterica]|uniref:Diguanylate cyclase n=1 Tax=Salmonella enterica I TaxID=59201 RepID=A0A379WRZ9_SALET|nr:diguanylate cyclase [Salmonella enterica subsp. enterica]
MAYWQWIFPSRHYSGSCAMRAEKDIEGEYQLYDNHLRLLTDSAPEQQTANTLNDRGARLTGA